jgi:outer membrane receptor protein involved in Fe transport
MLARGQIPIDYYGEMRYINTIQLPQKREVTGVFAQYDGRISDKLLLTTGVRYDRYSDFGSTVNPRLGLVYKANESNTLKFSYGQAFRAPSVAETRLANNSMLAGNLDLQPEKIKTYELHWSTTC